MILFECPICANGLKVKSELGDMKIKCPSCRAIMVAAGTVSPVPAGDSAGGRLPDPLTQDPSEPDEPATKDPRAALRPRLEQDLEAALTSAISQTLPGVRQETNLEDEADATQLAPPLKENLSLTAFLSPPQQPDEIGRLGNYRVLKVLGSGGMGVVFQAEDPSLQRLVAIKAILPVYGKASDSARKRFLREARAAAAIKHIHVVTIHQVGEDRGVPFLAMEFLQGEPLDQKLRREGKLPLAQTLLIAREMAEGLAAAHALGLVHRDIKPANTWLESRPGGRPGEFSVKILDFGLARSPTDDDHLTQCGAVVGTPAYMAPGQGNVDQLDPRGDLWSLGVVIYRMCTGKLPFEGSDALSTMLAVANTNPPSPAKLNPEVPARLSELVMKLLEKDAARRIDSAQSVAEILRELERPVAVPKRRGSRKPLLLAGLVGGLITVLLAGLLVWNEGSGVWNQGSGVRDQGSGVRDQGSGVGSQGLGGRDQESGVKVVPPDKKSSVEAPPEVPVMAPPPAEVRTVSVVRKFQHAGSVLAVAVSADGKRVLTGSEDRTAILWDAVNGNKLQTFEGHTDAIRGVALSDDGKYILTGSFDKTAALWNVASGKKLKSFHGHTGNVTCVAFSGDGKHVLTGAWDRTAILWDLAGNKVRTYQGHTEWVLAAILSTDGKHVLTGSADRTAILWDRASGNKVKSFVGHTLTVKSVALSSDGKHVLTGSWDRTAILWDTSNGKALRTLEGHTNYVTSVALSGDDRSILTASWDKTAILWDVKPAPAPLESPTVSIVQKLEAHTDQIYAAVLSSDARHIVTGSRDKTAILWVVKTAPR